MGEQLLMKSILSALQLRYKGRLKIWRSSVGAVKTESGRFLRFNEPGSPDLLGVLSGGRLVALEVKTAKGKTSPLQEAWLQEARELGALVGVVRSIEEAFALVDENLAIAKENVL